MKRVVILASGSGTLAQAIFAAPKDYEVVALICDRAGAKVIEFAREFGVEVELLELSGDRSIWNQEIFNLVSN
jgi:phosphoribosylglycinamide formyltransferase-1